MRSLLKDQNFLFLIIAGLILFCQQAWVPGFFHDGYLYAALAKNTAELGRILVPHASANYYSEFLQHPPLYFWINALFYKLTGSDWTSVRFLAALYPLGIALFIYHWLKKEVSSKQAFLTSLIFILLPPVFKKARFPHLDFQLCLFFMSSLFYYFKILKEKKETYWWMVGLFFGLALLTKGPPAIFICLVIFIHMLVTKKIKLLASYIPWLALLFGLSLFFLWGLLVTKVAGVDWWELYIKEQLFYTIVKGREAADYNPFEYIWFLLTKSFPWSFLFILGVSRRKKSELDKFFLVYFFAILVPMSLMKFKYSHYLIPLYPAYAYFSMQGLLLFSKKQKFNIEKVLKPAVVIGGLLLLVFPLTTKVKRDPGLIKSFKLSSERLVKNQTFGLVNEAYPFFSIANFLAYKDRRIVIKMTTQEIDCSSNINVYVIRNSDFDSLKATCLKNLYILNYDVKKSLYYVAFQNNVKNEYLK